MLLTNRLQQYEGTTLYNSMKALAALAGDGVSRCAQRYMVNPSLVLQLIQVEAT